MNHTDLKQGDVIAIDWDGKQRIAIFNEFLEPGIYPTDTLHIYIELDPTVKEEGLLFKCKGYDFFYDLKSITYRKATCKEQRKLYDELCKYFAEEHDKDWYKHFSDSSYYDVLDFLLEELDIEDTVNIPAFVYEIRDYMWDQMCEFMGQPNGSRFIEVEEESEDKMVSLDKACKVFQEMLMKYNKYIGHNIPMLEWEDEFRRKLEE